MRNRIRTLALATVFTLGAGAANAIEIDVGHAGDPDILGLDPANPYHTTGVTAAIVTGAQMAGMTIRVYFSTDFTDLSAANTDTAIWAPYATTGATDDGFAGSGTTRSNSSWYLYEQGPTIEGVWHLHNRTASPIFALEMIARDGGASFDIYPFPDGTPASGEGTPVSEDGNAFRNKEYGSGSPCPVALAPYCAAINDPAFSGDELIDAEYSNPLFVGPAGGPYVFYGDEYTRLFIEIPGGLNAGLPDPEVLFMGYELAFRADTDLAASAIIPGDGEDPEVPEPMTIALFGAGLLGLGALRRFRRKAGK